MRKLPPFMADASGYCYPTTWALVGQSSLTTWFGAVGVDGYLTPGTEPPRPWEGLTVACIGSGPSLTQEDCDAAHAAGFKIVTANDSWRRAPYADAMYATDHGWWQQHVHEITVPALRWTDSVPAAQEFDLHLHISRAPACNSGARAIELAADLGAARIVLLGFDCSLVRGYHWHGPHTRTGNPDEGTIGRWHGQFASLAGIMRRRGVDVLNCSRETALTCFPRASLASIAEIT